MQPVNNDMDNLFRQAADDYPLNTSGANFDKLRQQIDAETPVPPKEITKKKITWLLLLLLLPLAFLAKYYKADPTPQYSQTKGVVITRQDKNLVTRTDEASAATKTEKLQNKSDIKEVRGTIATNKIKNPEIREKETQYAKNTPVNLAKHNIAKQPPNKDKSLVSRSKAKQQSSAVSNTKEQQQVVDKEAVFLASGSKTKSRKASLSSADEYNKRTLERLRNEANKAVAKQQDASSRHLVDTTLQTVTTNKERDTVTLAKKSSANSNSKEVAKTRIETKPKPGVYIGIIAGPDISTVKTKQVNGLGYNLGFIVGYKTGRHLAFETGIIWNNKRYHAKGKDVTLDRLSIPSHIQLLYLNGTCEMIEIPLSVRYHLSAKTANNLYVGAGISSYIMKNEAYSYKSKRYNTEYYQKREYANSGNNWLSVLQLQAGYEINFKKGSSLRLEPYAKLPLKGIGIGKLPLTSTGLNIAFTVPLH